MSDLQCPATVLLVPDVASTADRSALDEPHLASAADRSALDEPHLANVFVVSRPASSAPVRAALAPEPCSSTPTHSLGLELQTHHVAAGLLSRTWQRPVELLANVVDARSLASALERLADAHRGETIAIVASGALIRELLGRQHAPVAPVALHIDSTGWRVIRG